MRRTAACLLLLTASAAAADPPALDIPAEVRPANGYVRFTPKTDAASVLYVGKDAAFAFPSEELKDPRRFLLPAAGLAPGRYRFTAVAASKTGEQAAADFVVVIDGPPVPPAPPGPGPVPPGPTPPQPDGTSPFDDPGLRVMVLFESAEAAKYPAGQWTQLFSRSLRDFLDAACVKEADGKTAGWVLWDKDTDASAYFPAFAKARPKVQPKSLPWIAVGNGRTGFQGPLPATAAETQALVSKYK